MKETEPDGRASSARQDGPTHPETYGFSPDASGTDNLRALQRAVDRQGTIVVTNPGIYKIAGTALVGSDTSLRFGAGVKLMKVPENGPFTHILLNRGALTKTYDQNIRVEGLHIVVNDVDVRNYLVYGLHGQIAFHYVRDLRIRHFRCLDLGRWQYGIHVCTFEDILIDDVIVMGKKDGVHLGRGRRFAIRNGVFDTCDDAIALNGHDYSSGNPEIGDIEDGIVEACWDLRAEDKVGFFCRILAGAWGDWKPGMQVRQSDTVVSQGRLYRVQMEPNGTVHTSLTQPAHETGQQVLDGINWGVVQSDPVYTAAVRNVCFRDIFLQKERTGFSIHFDNDRFSRSYYPGSRVPLQANLHFDNVRVLHDGAQDFLSVNTPIDTITVVNSRFRNGGIRFHSNDAMPDYRKTLIHIQGCIFDKPGPDAMPVLINEVPGKEIVFKSSSNLECGAGFHAAVVPGPGRISVQSDLTGLSS